MFSTLTNADFRWAFCEPGKAAPVDGDTPAQVRDAVQEYADVLLSTDTAAQGSTVGALLQQKYKQVDSLSPFHILSVSQRC